MNLSSLKFPIYGDVKYRGPCPAETMEQISFFNRIRKEYPDTYGKIALHPRNEALLTGGQFSSVMKHRAEGMNQGAVDIVIPGCPAFCCEMKRTNHTLSKWQDGQVEYLEAAKALGAFACVALGASAAWDAFCDYLGVVKNAK